jgi:tetratricopeptide (TPR) repeat protein
MAEERQQAYLELVQQLLNCESGHEPEILAAHRELVDEGLVAMALDLARMLAEREESDAAGSIKWLQGFAHNLAQALGLSSGDSKPQTQLKFLLTVLQAVSDSDGDSQVVYSLLGKNLGLLDELLIGVLQGWAKQTFAESEPKRVRSIAICVSNFGNLLQDFPLGNKAINIDLAITCYELLAEVFTINADPGIWATIQNNCANAYSDRINGDRADNLELAIEGYNSSLQVYAQEDSSIDWAMSQHNLSLAYSNRINGNRADNLELAIAGYESCLEIYTQEDYPIDWAMTQNNLSNAYLSRIQIDLKLVSRKMVVEVA